MLKGGYTAQRKWTLSQNYREKAVASQQAISKRELTEHTVVLPLLKVDDVVSVQNQYGKDKLKWDSSGIVVQVLPFNQYHIQIDGSRKMTLRNRKFLRQIVAPVGPKLI